MSRRIDVELTSDRGEGSWTWRAAGAKQPKGEVDAALLPDGAAIGDVLRAEADFDIEGITILSVDAPKAKRNEPERLEILGSGQEVEGVTTTLVEKKGRGKGRGDKGRGDKGRGDKGRGKGDRDGRGESRGGRSRGGTPPPPERPKKPKPPRLRVKRTHRDAAMAELSEAERPVAEQALKGGIPAVRDALRTQNEENKKAGRPPVAADAVMGLAEQVLPRLKAAEWRDRAEAAVEQLDVVDLRDLRSVVTAADGSARDDESRELAEQLRTSLLARVEHDHAAWLQELAETLADGRVARALNLSSRPPKAGAPLPRDLADRLAAAASAGLTSDVGQKRWQTVLESVARSPVRQNVVPEGIPSSPSDELLDTVRNLSMQVPQIAAAFGIEPQRPTRKRKRSRKPSGGSGRASGATGPAAAPPEPASAPRIPPPPDLAPPPAEPTAEAPAGDAAPSTPTEASTAAETETAPEAATASEPAEDSSNAGAGPARSEPEVAPETAERETAEPETAEPETAEPETAERETAEPETAEPETTVAAPETAEPETAEPETTVAAPDDGAEREVAATAPEAGEPETSAEPPH